jgi:hypothetical protein
MNGKARAQFQRRRRGNRQYAMSAAHGTAAQFHPARRDPPGRKQVKADGGARYVDNRIQRAHFVKGDVVGRNAVHGRFGRRYAGKYIKRARLDSVFKGRILYKGAYLFPRIVRVFMFMCVIMFMFVIVMIMLVRMFVFIRVIMIVMTPRGRRVNQSAGPEYAAAFFLYKIKLPAGYAKFVEFAFQFIGIYAQINKGAQGHVPRDSGKTVKVQRFHYLYPIYPWARRAQDQGHG